LNHTGGIKKQRTKQKINTYTYGTSRIKIMIVRKHINTNQTGKARGDKKIQHG
jgi:hypothetical protein